MTRKLFVFGLGYSALTLARSLLAEGWRVAGTTRDPAKAAALREAGIEAHLFGPGRPLDDPAAALAGTSHLLDSAPPEPGPDGTRDGSGHDPVLAHHADAIAALPLTWAGYLSTTGVYGDTGGAWVDEDSPLRPGNARGRERVEAEAGWLALWREHGVPVHLFRLAGIYGPGRSPVDQLRAGTARRIVKPGQVFSRIHVEDIAAVLRASMERPRPGTAYNVCDDEPTPADEVMAYAAGLLGIEPPPAEPYDPATASPMQRSFYSETRRVRNDRIRTELGVRLAYPTYREGMQALARSAG